MASVSVLHFMTYLGTKTDLTQYVHIFKYPRYYSSSYVSTNYKFYTDRNILVNSLQVVIYLAFI